MEENNVQQDYTGLKLWKVVLLSVIHQFIFWFLPFTKEFRESGRFLIWAGILANLAYHLIYCLLRYRRQKYGSSFGKLLLSFILALVILASTYSLYNFVLVYGITDRISVSYYICQSITLVFVLTDYKALKHSLVPAEDRETPFLNLFKRFLKKSWDWLSASSYTDS